MASDLEHTATARRAPPPPALPWQPPARAAVPACTVMLPDDDAGGAEPSLLPLLALWLAHEGWTVLVHRPGAAWTPESAAAVLGRLGIAPAQSADEVADRWARREPAAAPLALFEGRTADATARTLRVVPCPDAATERELGAWAERSGSATLCVADGTLGDARRCPRVEVWIGGCHRPDLGRPAVAEAPAHWAPLPRQPDPTATAVFVQQVLSGERPMPGPLLQLAGLIGRAAEAALAAPPMAVAAAPRSCL
jgi:hypothetical protein